MAWSKKVGLALAALYLSNTFAQQPSEEELEETAIAAIEAEYPGEAIPETLLEDVITVERLKADFAGLPEDWAEAEGIVKRQTTVRPWASPEYTEIYQHALPIPPNKEPKQVITNPVTGRDIWYYEVETRAFQKQVYSDLPATNLVGYDGLTPGPTFRVPTGVETVVRFVNNGPRNQSIHLHGSPSRSPFDGWADDMTEPGSYKDYYFPNYQSARTLWYHDHAVHITAQNVYDGLAGLYILEDSREDALGLPSGEFDIPLVLASKHYDTNGQLIRDNNMDVLEVNGQPWPFLSVQPRKYRFRFLNGAMQRSFALYLATVAAPDTQIPFQVIASDAGLLERSVETSTLSISMAERWEIVVDFSGFAGQSLELRNLPLAGGNGADPSYPATDRVMRFDVSADAVQDPSTVPTTLRDVPFPPSTTGAPDHHFIFRRGATRFEINGVGWADGEEARTLARVPRGTVEVWELENPVAGISHPIHVHLVDFRIIERRHSITGRVVQDYESAGLKDVVWLGQNETVLVEAHYQPWAGLYMFHCHNLLHEDGDMLAAFNVTQLEDLGYTETTDFSDPMDARYQRVPFTSGDFTASSGQFSQAEITARVQELANQQPYSELDEVTAALTQFYTNNPGNPNSPIQRRVIQKGPVSRVRRAQL